MRRYLPLFDYLGSITALYTSFFLHFALKKDFAVLRLLSHIWPWLFLAPLLSLVLSALLGLYSLRSCSRQFTRTRLFLATFLSFLLFVTLLFYLRVFQFPRLIVLFWTGLHFVFAYFLRLPFLGSWKEERLFVLYQGKRGKAFLTSLRARETPLGTILGGTDVTTFEPEELRKYLRHLVRDLRIDRVVLFLEPEKRESVTALLEEEGIPYELERMLSLLEEKHGQVTLTMADLLDYQEMVVKNPYLPFKYFLDRVLAGIFLVLLSPLLGILALLVFLDSPGPVLYWQERVGKDGKVFKLCKFRTMIPDAEKGTGAVLAQKNDPRVTRVGKILRKTRLDELPQLWNVLRGEMSLVGPRPERPEFVERWKKLVPHYEIRLLVKPGITGWAQILGKYDEGPETVWEKLEYDLYYLRYLSLSLDFEILVRTPLVMLLGKGGR